MNFSVVIPLYNKSYSIVRCVDSILNQSYRDFEIIVVNDGSTDDSLSMIKSTYTNEIQQKVIKIIDQPNQGVSVARNNGIKLSKYDYICLLDADDEWRPNFLEKMKALIRDYPEANLYSLAHLVKKEGSQLRKPKLGLCDSHRGYVNDFFKSSSKGEVVNSSKVCIRKKALVVFGGFPERVVAGEDLYVWIMLALKGKVACDMIYSTIVHQRVDNSRIARYNRVPYPLIFFSENKAISRSKSLDKYLFMIFYKHFFNSLFSLKFNEAANRLKVYTKIYF